MKFAMIVASLVLVAGGAAACGDSGGKGDGGSDAASQKDFCGAFQAFYDDLTKLTGEEDNLGEILKKASKRIRDVGTPEDIPDDAKEGLELTLDAIDELPDDATVDDMTSLEDKFSDADKKKTDAFQSYLEKTCPDIGGGSGDAPSEDSGS
jgi:hypothetical protein